MTNSNVVKFYMVIKFEKYWIHTQFDDFVLRRKVTILLNLVKMETYSEITILGLKMIVKSDLDFFLDPCMRESLNEPQTINLIKW